MKLVLNLGMYSLLVLNKDVFVFSKNTLFTQILMYVIFIGNYWFVVMYL